MIYCVEEMQREVPDHQVELARSILKTGYASPSVRQINCFVSSPDLEGTPWHGKNTNYRYTALDLVAELNLRAAPEYRLRGTLAKWERENSRQREAVLKRIRTGRTRGAGAGGFNRDIDNFEHNAEVARIEGDRIRKELQRREMEEMTLEAQPC